MPQSDPYGAKLLTDAMQAQKAFGPSAAAMAKAAGIGGPSAAAMAKAAGVFDAAAQRPGAKLAEALKPIGGTAQSRAFTKLTAGFKPIDGSQAAAAENLKRATDRFAGVAVARDALQPISTRIAGGPKPALLTDVLSERARPASHLPVPRFDPPPNYSAELLGHQRQAETRRAEERAIEGAWREQSLAVQRAMHAALLESEAARAADAEAAALREQVLVDGAEAGDKRESRLLRLTVTSVCVAVLVPLVQFVLPLI